jgi:hypothetical protein
MANKKDVSLGDTFVLDDADLEELDKLSLTGVMRDVTGVVKHVEQASDAAKEKDDGLDSLDLGYLVPEE